MGQVDWRTMGLFWAALRRDRGSYASTSLRKNRRHVSSLVKGCAPLKERGEREERTDSDAARQARVVGACVGLLSAGNLSYILSNGIKVCSQLVLGACTSRPWLRTAIQINVSVFY